MRPLAAGQLLGDKYRLVRLLGQGGMGAVWHAQHLTLNAPVALKFIESEQLDADALQRFLREARVAAALRSPHVVQILDYGIDEQRPHIAMELLEGETLAARLGRQRRLDLPQLTRVVQQVSRALARAHDEGIIHRDLKPENVFIVRNDDDELIKVLDFGIAKSTRNLLDSADAAPTRTGTLLGTPHYMSPEQVDGAKSLDGRTDIWSLGVLAYRCLLGELPFTGDSICSVALSICSRPLPIPSQRANVPAGFDAWFARACARDPQERFGSARSAASEFLELVGGQRAASGIRSASGIPDTVVLTGFTAQAPSSVGSTTAHATSADSPRTAAPRALRLWVALPLGLMLGAAGVAVLTWSTARQERVVAAAPASPAPRPAEAAARPAASTSSTTASLRGADPVAPASAPPAPGGTQPVIRPIPPVQQPAAPAADPPPTAGAVARKGAPPAALRTKSPRSSEPPAAASAGPAARAPARAPVPAREAPPAPADLVPATPAADLDLGI